VLLKKAHGSLMRGRAKGDKAVPDVSKRLTIDPWYLAFFHGVGTPLFTPGTGDNGKRNTDAEPVTPVLYSNVRGLPAWRNR